MIRFLVAAVESKSRLVAENLWGANSYSTPTVHRLGIRTSHLQRPFLTTRIITIDGVLTGAWASERLAMHHASLVKHRAMH